MDITIGQYNEIPEGTFVPFKGEEAGPVVVGDCNFVGEGTRILVGPEGFNLGDYCVIHNHTTIGGPGLCTIGHNCWFGQENWFDSTGGLTMGNGVRIGLRSHIWSHIASGEQVEGWLVAFRSTVIKDNVWCVGDNVHVTSGVTMHENSVAMAHAVVTKDCEADTVYAGVPARPTSMRIRRDVQPRQKMDMMREWSAEFCGRNPQYVLSSLNDKIAIVGPLHSLVVAFGMPTYPDDDVTYFDLGTKMYTKRLTQIERDFINFLKGNKARFIPKEIERCQIDQ